MGAIMQAQENKRRNVLFPNDTGGNDTLAGRPATVSQRIRVKRMAYLLSRTPIF